MTTSGTYNFQATPGDQILKEVFDRCGNTSESVSSNQVVSLLNSANYMFSDWINRGTNLSTINTGMVTIVPGQANYSLPAGTADIVGDGMTAALIIRQLNGTASSSTGVAPNAFDGNPLTACTQTAPNGFIAYDYGASAGWSIWYVGITSNVDATYTLEVDYSFDNAGWYAANKPKAQTYIKGQTQWIVLSTPPMARSWRIIETAGATLNIQELYFDTPSRSIQMNRQSKDWYLSVPNKQVIGVPSTFVVTRNRNPYFTVYLTPNNTYNAFVFNVQSYYQDFNTLIEEADVPQRFMDALVSGLAARLAQKYYPEKYQMLSQIAQETYQNAARADVDSAPIVMGSTNSMFY